MAPELVASASPAAMANADATAAAPLRAPRWERRPFLAFAAAPALTAVSAVRFRANISDPRRPVDG